MKPTERIYRRPAGRGFSYWTRSGEPVVDHAVIKLAKSFAVPPAWTDVQINLRPHARIIATGYDAAGRKQYIYHPAFRARQDQAKFARLLDFAERLPHLRRVTGQHLATPGLGRDKVMACMVRLIDSAYFRIGNDEYAQQNQTYGLTTMRSKHLTIEGDTLVFDYMGKAHQPQHKEVTDKRLAKVVAELDELPGYEIFKYYGEDGDLVDVKSDDLNAYLRDIMGAEFSAKDFRTWAGTLICAVALDALRLGPHERPLKKHVVEAVKEVASRLGNTPSIARASYIDPRVIDHYLNGTTIRLFLEQLSTAGIGMSREESAVVQLLRYRLVHKGADKH